MWLSVHCSQRQRPHHSSCLWDKFIGIYYAACLFITSSNENRTFGRNLQDCFNFNSVGVKEFRKDYGIQRPIFHDFPVTRYFHHHPKLKGSVLQVVCKTFNVSVQSISSLKISSEVVTAITRRMFTFCADNYPNNTTIRYQNLMTRIFSLMRNAKLRIFNH